MRGYTTWLLLALGSASLSEKKKPTNGSLEQGQTIRSFIYVAINI